MLTYIIIDRVEKLNTTVNVDKVAQIENCILLLIALCVFYEDTNIKEHIKEHIMYKEYALNAVTFLLTIKDEKYYSVKRDDILKLFMCYSAIFEFFHIVIIEHLQQIISNVLSIEDQNKIKKLISGTCNLKKFKSVNDKINESTSFNHVAKIRNALTYAIKLFVESAIELVCNTKECTFYDFMLVLMFDYSENNALKTARMGVFLIKMQNDLEAN